MTLLLVSAGCSGKGGGTADDASPTTPAVAAPVHADVSVLAAGKVIATVDDRFQSYNIEMVEVTGGEFWKPYDAGEGKVVRAPIDLRSERLRNLARALGPAYIRVSGAWASDTYFDPDAAAGTPVPAGYRGLLTGEQWAGVGDFARSVDGLVVTSFASNAESRDVSGAWKGDQARALLQFSRDHDVPVVAAELFNEPDLPGTVPAGYDRSAFRRDLETLNDLAAEVMPGLLIVGPGATFGVPRPGITPPVSAEDLSAASEGQIDIYSYHFYPKRSERCGSDEGPEVALTDEFLSRIDGARDVYTPMRDRYAPDASIWVTETAQAACGGDRWAATYRDVIRYVDTLGRLSVGDGDVVFHNTLVAGDYGLIDEDSLVPRPDYWAAVLWAQLMGPEVLDVVGSTTAPDLNVYARCTARGNGITYAVVNASTDDTRSVTTASGTADVYLLTSDDFDGTTIKLNGAELITNGDGTLPDLDPVRSSGEITIPPASVAYISDPATSASVCR